MRPVYCLTEVCINNFMAFYVRHWLKVQTRRCMQGMFNAFQVYSLCSVLKRRMKNSIAYCILGTLAIIVVLSAFRCSGILWHKKG